MEYLIENFTAFADIYMAVIIEVYLFITSGLFAVWMKPFTKRKSAAWIAAGVYLVLQTVNIHMGSGKNIDRLIAVSMIVASFAAAWLVDNRRNPIQKIFLCVVFRLISWLTIEIFSEMGMYESQLIMNFEWYRNSAKSMVLEYIIVNPIQYGLALLLLYAVIRIIHKTYRYKTDEMSIQEFFMMLTPAWSLLLVRPIMSSYFILWMDGIGNGSINENIQGNPFRLMFSICSLISIIAIFILYQRLTESREKEFALRSFENQLIELKNHIEQIEQIQNDIRSLKHDMGNHLAVIMRLSDSGNKEELSDYIGTLKDRYDETDLQVKTGHPVTDVVLSEYAGRFDALGIPYTIDFSYPQGIDAFDMSIVLGNILQNALEASERSNNPQVCLKCALHSDVFIISIRNNIDNKVEIGDDGIPPSTKKSGAHGYGIKNVRSVAAKYKGDIEIRQENTGDGYVFIENIMMIGK